MKKPNAKKLALRTQTVAALSSDDLRRAGGASYTVNIGYTTLNVGFTTQLSNGAWTFTIAH